MSAARRPVTATPALDAFGFLIFDGLAAAVICGHFVYVFLFNNLSSEIRLGMAAALLVAQIVLCAWTLIMRPAPWSLCIAAALGIKVLCWAVSILTGVSTSLYEAELPRIASRELVPYIAVIWLLTFSARLPYRLLAVVGLASAVLGGVLAIISDPVVILGQRRLAAFTGGDVANIAAGSDALGLHSSAYFILLALFILDGLRRTGRLPGKLAYPALGFLVLVLLGYQVRTMIMMLAVYALGHAWSSSSRRIVLYLGLWAVAVTLICTAGAFVLTNLLDDVLYWGSGRVGSYQFRIEMLMQRDLLPLVFGTGPGSDVFVTPLWWWDAKDSHSDLLHTVVETGLLGFLALGLFFAALWMRLSPASRPLLLSLFACSAISNGPLVRPTEFFLLALAMAAAERPEMTKAVPAMARGVRAAARRIPAPLRPAALSGRRLPARI